MKVIYEVENAMIVSEITVMTKSESDKLYTVDHEFCDMKNKNLIDYGIEV